MYFLNVSRIFLVGYIINHLNFLLHPFLYILEHNKYYQINKRQTNLIYYGVLKINLNLKRSSFLFQSTITTN